MFKNATAMDGRSSDFKGWKAMMLIAVLILAALGAAIVVDSDSSNATNPSIKSITPTGPIILYSNGTAAESTKTITVEVNKQSVDGLTLSVQSNSTNVTVSSSHPSIGSDNKATFTVTGTNTVTNAKVSVSLMKDTETYDSQNITVSVRTHVTQVDIVKSSGAAIPGNKLSMEYNATTPTTVNVKESITPSTAYDKTVTWTTSDSNIVKFDKLTTGVKLTAVAPGTATIKATSTDGSKVGTLTVEVVVPVTGISLAVDGDPTVKIGSKIKVIATILPENATNKKITVSTSRSDLLTVEPIPDAVGNKVTVTLDAIGDTSSPAEVTVTATTVDKGKTASCVIKVERVPVTGVKLIPDHYEMEMDDELQLKATIEPEDATVKTVTWASSNPEVATIDTNTGKITAKSIGKTTITVTTTEKVEGKAFTATCTVEVTNFITIPVEASLDSQGNATISDTQVTEISADIKEILADKQYPIVAIDADGASKLTIPSNLVKIIQEAEGGVLYVFMDLGTVLFDEDSVDKLDISGKTVGITFTKIDSTKYPKFGDCYIYDISILKDGTKVETNFGSDRAEIAIYHNLETGEDKDKLLAAYVIREDYGLKIKDASVITDGDWDESAVVIKAPHMSLFMFMFHESEYVKTAGIDTVIAIVFLVIIVILGAGIAFFTFNENASEKLQNLFKRNNTKRPPMSPPGQEPYGYYPGNQFNGYGNNYNNYNNNNGNNNYR